MSIRRVSVPTSERSDAALLVETGRGTTVKIDHSEKGDFVGVDDDATEALLEAEMVTRAPLADKSDLETIRIHINRLSGPRQGEFVIATGPEERNFLWPEEETEL